MATTTHIVSAILSPKKTKLVLRSAKDQAANEFFSTLPAGRWDQSVMAWTADALPSAAWRVLNHCPLPVEADDAVLSLASQFAQTLDYCHEGQQPAIRKTDGWSHQVDAYWFASGKAGTMLAHDMGVGKTKVAVDLICNRGARKTLILCPLSVLGVWRRELQKHAGTPLTTLVLDGGTVAKKAAAAEKFLAACERSHEAAVVVVNYEAAKVGHFAAWSTLVQWDAVICDECHPAGTMISTPTGRRPIEELRAGDVVWGINHENGMPAATVVQHTFKRVTDESLVTIGETRMTPEHPVWTKRGYVPAREVREDDSICRIEEETESNETFADLQMVRGIVYGHKEDSPVLRPVVRHEVRSRNAREPEKVGGSDAENDSASRRATQTTKAPCVRIESVSESRDAEKSTGCAEGNRLSDAQWRQWQGADGTAETSCRAIGMENGTSGHGYSETIRAGVGLQDRHCKSRVADCDRSGRTLPHDEAGSSDGHEENGIPEFSGMGCVAVFEPPDNERPGGRYVAGVEVFNIETATGNYFADGLLVHNSHRIKAHDSQTSKYAAEVGKQASWRLCLSGTPMPNGPLDVFGQYRFLDRGIFGSSFHHFRNRYAKLNQMFPGKVDAWINQDEFKERFALLAHRVTADDVLDLPEAIHVERRVTMSLEGQRVYDSLQDDLIADIGGGVVTATNALVRLLRLQQATSGYAVEDESKTEVSIDSAKSFALMELLEDIGPAEPIVVLCVFRHDLAVVRNLAESLKRNYGEVSGSRKDGVSERGMMAEGLQVVGVQIRAGGLGIDLTAARYCILFSVGFSLGDYDQALARVHRPGQTRTTYYYHLIASGTVDEVVYGALANKREVVEEVFTALKR